MSYKLLIADDDADFMADLLKISGEQIGEWFDIDTAETPEQCRQLVKENNYDVVILDIRFSLNPYDQRGLELIPEIKAKLPEAYLIMLTGIDDNETMAKCRELGANSYIFKGDHGFEDIAGKIVKAIGRKNSYEEEVREGEKLAASVGAVIASDKMKEVFTKAAKARKSPNLNCIILGPSGSGKEFIAKVIGEGIEGAPFIKMNCATLQDTLVESEFFGHEKGSFTGATSAQKGKLELADGGTLFLDEIACLTPKAQATLLRVLETGDYYRTGGQTERKVKIRIVGATNEDLRQKIAEGGFREDLFRRICGEYIEVSPLCERPEDIQPIIHYVISKSSKPHVRLDPALLRFLTRYSWPGNVRELITTIKYMVDNTMQSELEIGDLPKYFTVQAGIDASTLRTIGRAEGRFHSLNVPYGLTLDEAHKFCMKSYIEATGIRVKGKLTTRKLADMLHLPKTNFLRRMKKLNIDVDQLESMRKARKQHEGNFEETIQ